MLDRFDLPYLLGLFLTTCTIAAEDLSYKPCTIAERKTCEGLTIGHGNGFNEEQCKLMCDVNERCNFVVSNIGEGCSLFQACEELKNFKDVSTIFAKQGNLCPTESPPESPKSTITITTVPECKCDHRGVQKSTKYGDWCWVKEDPCKLLTGKNGNWNWVRCHDNGDPTGRQLIKCPSHKPEFYRFMHHGHCKNGHSCNGKNCNTVEATVMDCRNRCERLGIHIGYFVYVPGSSCACYTKCERDERHQDHFAFQILRPNCVIAEVGSGKGSKNIPMGTGYQCPELVDITNWMDGHTWPDKFSVYQTPNTITVTRTDLRDGWGMNLRFHCCQDSCGTGYAYHSGDVVNENALWKTSEGCRKQCLGMLACNFWDYGKGYCRLRSNSGPRGKVAHTGYAYGTKYCLSQDLDCYQMESWQCLKFGGPCCLNGGSCMTPGKIPKGGNICNCPLSFIGQYCEIDVCAGYCLNDGTCTVDVSGAPKCKCLAYFVQQADRCFIQKYIGFRCEREDWTDISCITGKPV